MCKTLTTRGFARRSNYAQDKVGLTITGSQLMVRGALQWMRDGANDKHPLRRQLTTLVLHNDSPHFSAASTERARGWPADVWRSIPTLSCQAVTSETNSGSGMKHLETVRLLLAKSGNSWQDLTFAIVLLPVQIHGCYFTPKQMRWRCLKYCCGYSSGRVPWTPLMWFVVAVYCFGAPQQPLLLLVDR